MNITNSSNGLRNVRTFCAKSAQKSPTLLRRLAGRYAHRMEL
jgi:hypothetical protein